jgi:SAM-dependent methyltransferase
MWSEKVRMANYIDRAEGRVAFGSDPAGYHAVRPAYPDWVFKTLRDRCGLKDGTAVFEIGPGTGTATRRILDLGANPLVAIEPDRRLADYLRNENPDEALEVTVSTFEEAALPDAAFDLGISATAFHWLDEKAALTKVAALLRPGGWWAMVWNVFGDDTRPDPFHEATKELLGDPSNPSAGEGGVPFALDHKARIAAIERADAFEDIETWRSAWSLALDPDQTAALYATYSNISVRVDRSAVLTELRQIALEEFGGRVSRNMITSLYVSKRRT